MKPVYLWRVLIKAGIVSLQDIQSVEALRSLDDTAFHIPAGAYTTLRTYAHTKALHLEDHFRRLEDTARLAGFPLQLERSLLRQAMRLAIDFFPLDQDVRLRLSIDLSVETGTAWIGAEQLIALPEQAYSQGVRTVTCDYVRRNPQAKLSETMAGARRLRQELPADVNEALMVDANGCFLEGLSSNFYVIANGRLWTAEQGVLPGITRLLVLEEARSAGIPLELNGYPVADLAQAEEALITSASRAVLPVRQVDDCIIGTGQPGTVTRLLAARYAARINMDMETI